jgi:hypothetical protein
VKKSNSVAAPLLASAALAMLAGCKQQQMKRCVDEHNTVVDNSFCDTQQNQPNQPNNNYYHPVVPVFYHYYYGGTGGFYPGSIATGGGFTPAPGVSYSTSRGGFGHTFSDGGGHGGAGE